MTVYNKAAVAVHLLFGSIFAGSGSALIIGTLLVVIGHGPWYQVAFGLGGGAAFMSPAPLFYLDAWHVAHHHGCRWYEED